MSNLHKHRKHKHMTATSLQLASTTSNALTQFNQVHFN